MHGLGSLLLPDLWQQEAVRALREGRDVVVHAPTGAGKTFVFELLQPELKGQAIFTVPTRALANDKLAEWRARGWNVGIATGDLALDLDAHIVVATLETQKPRLMRGDGPRLLVIDEYQMIADPVRGVNYELSIALAPPGTQLLLLSGSVGNPAAVVDWLRRIGRDAQLVSHAERPVPLEQVDLDALPEAGAGQIRGFWPRQIAKALKAGLGPVLLFAPRRNAAEQLARELAAGLPPAEPLALSREQEDLAGPRLARLLRARVAFHHSGLGYALRAGVIEPLAKRGHLRVVVATTGLAAGINFSMRSVAVTDTRYFAGHYERQVQPDELLQMYGRAGRRGLDERGHALVADAPRLHDARPRTLRRAEPVDWPTLLGVMRHASERGARPFEAALEVSGRLFSPQAIPLGVEHSRETGPMPCGLWVDMERARFARRGVVEMENSRGEWERAPETGTAPLGELLIRHRDRWRPALSLPATLEGIGRGNLCKLSPGRYGRELTLATTPPDGSLAPVKWLRKILRQRSTPRAELEAVAVQHIGEWSNGGAVHDFILRKGALIARVDFSKLKRSAQIDSHGAALADPPTRQALPEPCRACPQLDWCQSVEIVPTPAFHWRRLGLVEADGRPTRRGVIFSFFNNGEGLAIAVALEDAGYPISDLLFDLANLRAGHRFAENDSPLGGRLGIRCQQAFERADHPGYLEMGTPINYGAGASEVVRELVERGTPKRQLLTESLRPGDIERALIEWRSVCRHIVLAPDCDWERWRELKAGAAPQVEPGAPGLAPVLPPLLASQR